MRNDQAMPKTPPQSLIGTREAARMLDVDKATLTRWVKAGRVKIVGQLSGGALIFHRSEIERECADIAAARAERAAAPPKATTDPSTFDCGGRCDQ